MSAQVEKPDYYVPVETKDRKSCRLNPNNYVVIPRSFLLFGGSMLALTAIALLIHTIITALE